MSAPTLGQALEIGLSGESEQSAMNSVPTAFNTLEDVPLERDPALDHSSFQNNHLAISRRDPAYSSATLFPSSLSLDKKDHSHSSPKSGSGEGSVIGEGEPHLEHEGGNEKALGENEGEEMPDEGEGSGLLTGLRLYLCFGAFMLAVFVR